jgi:predicted alpha/beta hydrolase family esterase
VIFKQVLFVQGGGADVHDGWDNKLVDSLRQELGAGFQIRYPRMPNEADPSYRTWKAVLLEELGLLSDASILVGHSLGATFLVHVLADLPIDRFGGIFVISAPFAGDGGWPADKEMCTNLSGRLSDTVPIIFYQGTADKSVPIKHLTLYAEAIPHAAVRKLKGRDHQLNNDLSVVADDIHSLAQWHR